MFSSNFHLVRAELDRGYAEMASVMVKPACQQDGFLGVKSAQNEYDITVLYKRDLESIRRWKENSEYSIALRKGHDDWLQAFKVRMVNAESDYVFEMLKAERTIISQIISLG